MIKMKVRKIGNSHGVILPKEMMARLKLEEGATLIVTETVGGYQLSADDGDLQAEMEAFEEGRRQYRNALRELAK